MAGSRPSGTAEERAAPSDVGVGSHLGKYEIIKQLATGGMAEIFLARVSGLPGFQKLVVIKRILPQLATKTDFVEMFLDEARIAATLQHANVVQMYDVGVVDRNYFIAMEYLHGEDVRAISKALKAHERRLPIEHALNIVIGIASGLHYAHEKVGFDGRPLQIVHRDVTPQNVIVTYDGAVKLLDFGIAKASNRFGETRFGTLKGKVPYMSPEQCRGEPLDRRSDIFSLGIMLYETTLGRRLYVGKSDFEVLKQIVEAPVPPPRTLDPEYPPELEAIVMRALEKEKEQRYQTAREMQVDLEALVRADRMHVSPIALTSFMEELFEPAIGAWRQAQARGKTLDEHLTTIQPRPRALEDEDEEALPGLGETATHDAEAVARERAEFKARIHAQEMVTRVTPSRPLSAATATATGAAERVPTSTAVVTPEARRRMPPPPRWLLWSLGTLTAVLLVAALVVRERRAVPRTASGNGAARLGAKSGAAGGEARVGDGELAAPAMVATTDPAARPRPATPSAGTTAGATAGTTLGATAAKRPATGTHAKTTAAPRPAALAPKPPAPKPPAPAPRPHGDGTLLLASSPWCNVHVDGVDKGPTPVSLKLPAGRHTVLLSNPEFKITRTLTVNVNAGETVRKRLDFEQ